MALPDNTISSLYHVHPYRGGRRLPILDRKDREFGGIALNDPSRGLEYQVWRAEIPPSLDKIVISADEVPPFTIITGQEITEVSLSFDQNMEPAIAYVEAGSAKLRWFDSSQSAVVVTDFGPTYKTPRVSMDDKGDQSGANDVIFAYVRDHQIYYRQQRDRYEIEYLVSTRKVRRLQKIGMTDQYRFQFLARV